MRLLVTGATGFIGSHLVENLLQLGHKVRVLIRREPEEYPFLWLRDGSVEVMKGDITNTTDVVKATRYIDVIFHLAAMLGKWGVTKQTYYQVNVSGTEALIEQSLKGGVRYFIYLSTTGVMGWLRTVPADIDHPYAPISLYEKSKCQAELKVSQAVTEKNLPATIIRPSHVYGPRDPNTVKLFKMMKLCRIFPVMRGGHILFQPIYVDDLVRALMSCMDREAALGKTYIVAGMEAKTFKEFFELSARLLGVHVTFVSFPVGLARLTANVGEELGKIVNREPFLTRSRVDFFSRQQAYSIARICEDTGFVPKVNVEDGLQRTIRWYRNKGWL